MGVKRNEKIVAYTVEHEVDGDGEDSWDVVNEQTGEIVQSFWVHIEAIELAEKLNAQIEENL